MRRIALATIAAVTTMSVMPVAASAEPMVLTAMQMASITAAAAPTSINVNVVFGDILVQTNRTIQIANAIAVAIANCGVCVGGAPSASSLAAASNANTSGQQITR
jgi:hypothetical protein